MTPTFPAELPEPPYFAAIFSSRLAPAHPGYEEMAERMVALAAERPRFLGLESVRGADGAGITVSYWRSEADIAGWKADAQHRIAQERGYAAWYETYSLRVARIERAYSKDRRNG